MGYHIQHPSSGFFCWKGLGNSVQYNEEVSINVQPVDILYELFPIKMFHLEVGLYYRWVDALG